MILHAEQDYFRPFLGRPCCTTLCSPVDWIQTYLTRSSTTLAYRKAVMWTVLQSRINHVKTPWFWGYSKKAYYFRVCFRSWSLSCLSLRLVLCLHHWQRQTAERHCSASAISISFAHFIAQFVRLPFSTRARRRRTRVCRERFVSMRNHMHSYYCMPFDELPLEEI